MLITPKTHEEMIRHYPIAGLVENWYFRKMEVSAGCYVVEGNDTYGRGISIQTENLEKGLAECVKYAREIPLRG